MIFQSLINEVKYYILEFISFIYKIQYRPSKVVSYKHKMVSQNFVIQNVVSDNYEIFEIKNARIWGNNGTVIVNDKFYIKELNRSLPSVKRNPIFYQHNIIKPKLLKGSAAIVTSVAGDVFYHWMIDILPRLIQLQKHEQYSKIEYFILNKISHQFQIDTLNQLEIPKSKIIEVANLFDYHFEIESLIFPSFTSEFNKSSILTIKLLQNTFNLNIAEPNNFSQYIYLSRRAVNSRILLQEEEIYAILSKKGFERFYAEDYSIKDQIGIFKNAKVIIGPHGSGFTNIVFCKPHTIIIDICAPEWINDCFKGISELNNLKYHRILGIKHKVYRASEVKRADIMLDIELFKDQIDQLIYK